MHPDRFQQLVNKIERLIEDEGMMEDVEISVDFDEETFLMAYDPA
jgi:hypothetical protein